MKRLVLWVFGLVGMIAAVGGLWAAISGFNASHFCTLTPGSSACHSASAEEFFGVVLLVGGVGIVILVLLWLRGDERRFDNE